MKKLLSIALLIFLFSCEKEKTTTTIVPTLTEMLTSAAWKVTNYSSPATDSTTIATLKDWNDNLKTSTLYVTYKSNGTYLYSDSSEYGTWELSGTKSILFDKGTSNELVSTIDNVSTTNLAITYPWEMSPTLTVNVTESAVR
ncbi:MAG: hypothetical protein JHD28_06455 [Bacteroidia bacterium]|nr:hypothetical protein [Bacteroidia bacterium]